MDHKTCEAALNISDTNLTKILFNEKWDSITLNGNYLNMTQLKCPCSREIWKSLEILDYLKVLACAVVIIAGLLGNVSIILTVALNRSMRTTINFYVANLAAADAMICVMCMLPHAIAVVSTNIYILGSFMCKFHNFTEMACLICSVLTLSAISCDRFFAVMFPIRARAAKQRTALLITITWIISVLVSIPLLIVKQHLTIEWKDFFEYQCSEKWPIYWYIDETGEKCESRLPERFTYYTISLIILYFLPVVIMIIAYSSILWKVRKTDVPGEQNEANINVHSRARKKVNKMVFFVLVAFIFCWTPIQVIVMYSAYVVRDSKHGPIPGWMKESQWVSQFLAYTNSFINPIIYGIFNKTFREGLCKVLKCGNKRRQFGISGLTRLTFTTRFTSSLAAKSLKSNNVVNKASQKSNKEIENMHPVLNGDTPPPAKDTCV